MDTYELFNNGKLVLPEKETGFAEIEWSKHSGTISIMQMGVPHEVVAGSEGLYINTQENRNFTLSRNLKKKSLQLIW